MKKHIPNTITCCNLISGCVATVFALYGVPEMALLFIILGAVFDFFDGMTARVLGVSSPIGKELDSLADDVTFGVAPASILFSFLGSVDYPSFLEEWRTVIPFFAFIISAFWGSLIEGFGAQMMYSLYTLPLLLIGIVVSSWLLVAEIPMFALKFKHWGFKGNEIKYGFVIFSAIALISGITYGIITDNIKFCYAPFSVIILAYIAVSIATQKK